MSLLAGQLLAQEAGNASAADSAFEAGEWAVAVDEYRALLSDDRLNGVYWLRTAQAQRELGQSANALETLERARVAQAPEAMVELERARNLVALNQTDTALRALVASDHAELRSLSLLDAEEFRELRSETRFQQVYRSVRRRIYPCEAIPAARDFDFWVGHWEVRLADGTRVGRNTISKQDGGCTILEQWDGAGGASGTSVNYFMPSRDQWRQVWVGSGGSLIDIVGSLVDGSIRMEGTIEYVGQDKVVALRGAWTELPDGRVRQFIEEFDIVAQAWQVWFDGYYTLVGQP